MSGRGAARAAAADAAARAQQRQLFMGMNAYDRHRKMMADLARYYGMQLPSGDGQVRPECAVLGREVRVQAVGGWAAALRRRPGEASARKGAGAGGTVACSCPPAAARRGLQRAGSWSARVREARAWGRGLGRTGAPV